MKKFGKLLVIAALAMVSYSASAELAPQWTKGTKIGNANIGFLGNSDFGATVSLDYVLVDEWWMGHFTVGGEVGLSTWNYGYWKSKNFVATPRCTYGLNITDNFEVHAAVAFGLGFMMEKYDYDNVKEKNNEPFLCDQYLIGCRYFFMDNLAVSAETGYADRLPEFRVGISCRF